MLHIVYGSLCVGRDWEFHSERRHVCHGAVGEVKFKTDQGDVSVNCITKAFRGLFQLVPECDFSEEL